MHAPFLRREVIRTSIRLQADFEGKGQGLTLTPANAELGVSGGEGLPPDLPHRNIENVCILIHAGI